MPRPRVELAVLLEDGDYQTGYYAKQKAKSRTREKLWQAIQRAQLWHPQVNDDKMPSATAEQVRVHAAKAGSRCTPRLKASRHSQIEDVASWLAEMGRRANWMSNDEHGSYELNVVGKAATMREMWEERLANPTNGREEADRFAARKHRLVALFGSAHCYSANVHADTNDLKQLVTRLTDLSRLPNETPPEGLKLLARAWDEFDIAEHLADRYKMLAKLLFIVQLLISWAIVVSSTLYASWDDQDADGGADGEDGAAESKVSAFVSDSLAINALGEIAFALTIIASFLISFDSYINAKARPTHNLTQSPHSLHTASDLVRR